MAPKINIGPFLSDLQRKKDDGETWDELAAWLHEEHGIVCDSRTIRRRLKDADATSFGTINLDSYMDEIMRQREEGVPLSDIVDHLMKQYSVRTSERTLKRRFQQWGLPQLYISLNEEEEEAIDRKSVV